MPDYDFKSLSPIDFEALVRDLVQAEHKILLESFKVGKDQGIDFRYSSNKTGTLVVQCKHYADSSFQQLLRSLKTHEVEKATKLNPQRYILATSLGLTPKQKEDLLGLFSPLIKSPTDVLGREDLNNFLGRHQQIERLHFKLWFLSTTVFEEMFQARLKNLSREALARIQADAKYYVQNDSFNEAIEILESHNFVIISGIPGIGKTTLAEMLLLRYVSQGYDVVKIESDISEARQVDYVNHKRVFYYDDFLGQASFAEKLKKNEDQSLLDFMETIRKSKVSKLILTTREYILNQARLVYEKLNRATLKRETCIVDLSKYTRLIRAQILFNHLYFCDLPVEYKKVLLKGKNYLKVIDHQNYSPRIIDLMTDCSRLTDIAPTQYLELFLSNLDNPLELWRHAFEQQLSMPAKSLLLVLTTIPREVFLDDLKKAFISYQKLVTSEYNQTSSPSDFTRALKELEGNFTHTYQSGESTIIRFHNPSVRDFLEQYFEEESEFVRALRSAVFYEQVVWLWNYGGRDGDLRIKKHVDAKELISALRRAIDSPACELCNIQSYGKTYKGTRKSSFEERFLNLTKLSNQSQVAGFADFLGELLESWQKRLSQNRPDKGEAMDLLETLERLNLCSAKKHPVLYQDLKSLFMKRLYYPEDFDPWLRFADTHSRLVSDEDREAVREEFVEFAKVFHSEQDDPDLAREEDWEIEKLGKEFHLDVSKKVAALEERATELESNAGEDYQDDERRFSTGSDRGCTDDEIASIFRNLQ